MSDTLHMVEVEALHNFVVGALASQRVPEEDAQKVASLMVEADLLGYETHGVFRLRQYLARLHDGGCNATPDIRTVQETAATALIDGDNGLGHLALDSARQLAMQKAEEAGIGWVGVRSGNHAGPLALYVRPQAMNGMMGMAGAVGSANHVPAYGATDILLGTNPIAISSPGDGSDPFVLDMATTVAAMGKIKVLAQKGEPMPEGWMIGKDGRPITDPSRHSEGFMLPIGGPKGFGLSVAIGLMAGVLNGAAFGSDVVDFTKDTKSETNTGQFVLALNIAAFGSPDDFTSKTTQAFEEFRASPPLPGYEPVRMPGEGKGELLDQRLESGLELSDALIKDLRDLSGHYGFASI